MLARRLCHLAASYQRKFPTLWIGVLAAAVRLDFTIQGCVQAWPGRTALEIGALGVLCEKSGRSSRYSTA